MGGSVAVTAWVMLNAEMNMCIPDNKKHGQKTFKIWGIWKQRSNKE
jgi:hypothetical protein